MKLASKLVFATALTALGGVAQAAIVNYTITGGNWDSTASWSAQATGAPSPYNYDNGETPPCVNCPNLGGAEWLTPPPPAQNGTYSGTLAVDTATNAVVGGSMSIVGGTIADAVVVGTTWWVRQYNNLVIDFAANTATGTASCYGTIFAPVGCGPAVVNAGTVTAQFAPRGGIASQDPAGAGGIAYLGATFDVNTGLLAIFRDGRRADATGGTDVLQKFTLQVVPVPAAAWLLGSALGLLGVARRKLAA